MFDFFVAETSDLTEISKIMSDSFQVIFARLSSKLLNLIGGEINED